MIEQTIDLKIINEFLKNFNIKIEEISVFQKFLIYKKNNENIGFLDYSLIYDRLEINYIFVNENYRECNIASLLVDYMIEKSECKSISLEVNENNAKAINFYKKNKFLEFARRKNYYNNADALLMIRELV